MYPRSRPWQCVSVSYSGWLCSSSTSLCVVIQNDVLSPTHPHSPGDLLMVHTVCGTHTQWASLADSCHADSGCAAWPTYRPTPTTWTSKLSQKLSTHTRVYTGMLFLMWFLCDGDPLRWLAGISQTDPIVILHSSTFPFWLWSSRPNMHVCCWLMWTKKSVVL